MTQVWAGRSLQAHRSRYTPVSTLAATRIGPRRLFQFGGFTRLTNAFSKKLENLKAAIALHFAHYNFCQVHSSLRITPAMAAGISESVWGVENLLPT